MTQAAKKVLEEFDALQDADRTEVLSELLRRMALAPHDLPAAEDLTAAADRFSSTSIDANGRSEDAAAW